MISERLEISSHRTGKSKCLKKILVPGCVISRLFKCEHIKGGGKNQKKKKKKEKKKKSLCYKEPLPENRPTNNFAYPLN